MLVIAIEIITAKFLLFAKGDLTCGILQLQSHETRLMQREITTLHLSVQRKSLQTSSTHIFHSRTAMRRSQQKDTARPAFSRLDRYFSASSSRRDISFRNLRTLQVSSRISPSFYFACAGRAFCRSEGLHTKNLRIT